MGGLTVLAVAFTFAGTPDGLENALGAVGENLLGIDQVLVGHFEIVQEHRAWLGTVVYAPGIDAAERLLDDLHAYRLPAADQTPEPARAALCAQGIRCDRPANGTDRLMADLHEATVALRADTGAALLGDITIRMTRSEGLVVVAIVEAAPSRVAATEQADAKVRDVVRGLQTACLDTLNDTRLCPATYVEHSVRAIWNESWGASLRPLANNTTAVMGPLSWVGGKVLPSGLVAPPPRTPLFLPTLALLLVAVGIVLSIALHHALEYFLGNAAIPLPPLATLLGVLLLFLLDADRTWDAATFIGGAYGLLFVGYVLAYRILDLSGVHFFTLSSTLLILLAALASFLTGIEDLLLDQPLGIVSSLYAGDLNTQAANLAAKTLTTAGVASLAVIIISAIVAVRAHRAGVAHLHDRELDALLRRKDDALWRRLDELQRAADDGRISHAAHASILARVYGHARRRADGWWWREGLFGRQLHAPTAAAPGLAARAADGIDPLDLLWERHVEASRRARSMENMAMA